MLLGPLILAGLSVFNLNQGWEFKIADFPRSFRKVGMTAASRNTLDYNGSSEVRADAVGWTSVDLPHDWAVGLPVVTTNALNGSKAIGPGFPGNSIAWYRRNLDIPAEMDGKRVFLEFDGVYRDAQFWINGIYLGRNESGYIGCRYGVSFATCRDPD